MQSGTVNNMFTAMLPSHHPMEYILRFFRQQLKSVLRVLPGNSIRLVLIKRFPRVG